MLVAITSSLSWITDVCFISCPADINIGMPHFHENQQSFFFWGGGHSHVFCCMKWDCWGPRLPKASLACFRQWSSGMLILVMSPACLSKFLHFFLSWTHLFKNHCYSRLSEWGHLGVYETVADIYQSRIWACVSLRLENGQPHSLGWDLSAAWYHLHLNLTSSPGVPADSWVLFCTLQVWWLLFQKEERLSGGGQVYKNIRGKRG